MVQIVNDQPIKSPKIKSAVNPKLQNFRCPEGLTSRWAERKEPPAPGAAKVATRENESV